MQGARTVRLVGNVSLWLTISGLLLTLFILFGGVSSRTAVIAAGSAFLIGLAGYPWSWPKIVNLR